MPKETPSGPPPGTMPKSDGPSPVPFTSPKNPTEGDRKDFTVPTPPPNTPNT